MSNLNRAGWRAVAIALTLGSVAYGRFALAAPPEVTHESERYAPHQKLLLTAGMQSIVDLNFEPCANMGECIRITNQALMQVQYSPAKKQLVITPVRQGETTIVLRDHNGDVAMVLDALVSIVNLERRVSEIRELLKDCKKVHVAILGDAVQVDGEVDTLEQLERVGRVMNDPENEHIVINLVTPTAAAMQHAAKMIQERLSEPGVKIVPFQHAFVAEGESANPQRTLEAAQKLARALGFVPLKNAELVISRLTAR